MSETKLAKRLVKAMNHIDAVTKSGRNEKQGYSYVKAADVANEVRKVLVAEGVAFTYSVDSTDRWEKPTNSGGTLFFCEVRASFRFIDQDSGEVLEAKGVGWGADSLDKAPYKAMTGALKYALRMNFLIPDEEDPEKTNELYEEEPVRAGLPHGAAVVVRRPGEGAIYKPAPTPIRTSEPLDAGPAHQINDDPPMFDEHNEMIEHPSAIKHREQKQARKANKPTAEERKKNGWISEGQERRLWFFIKQSGIENADVNQYIADLGITDISQLPWQKYSSTVVWAGGPAEEKRG